MRRFSVPVLLALWVACGKTASSRASMRADSSHQAVIDSCGVSSRAHMTGQGIGAIRVGSPIAGIRRRCRVVRDTVESDDEGNPERQLFLDLGPDTAIVRVENGRVGSLVVRGAVRRTVDSLGVGTTLGRLRLKDPRGAEGEGGLFVMTSRNCGLSFHLAYVVKDSEHRQEWSADELRAIPDSTRVDRVLIIGCGEER
jgi:hypothetical protein